MPGSIVEVTLALIVIFYVAIWIRRRLAESQNETMDEREARDAAVNQMVDSALGSRPRRRRKDSEDEE